LNVEVLISPKKGGPNPFQSEEGLRIVQELKQEIAKIFESGAHDDVV